MQQQKTQQFAKFFIKDIKSKPGKYKNNKSNLDEFNFSSLNQIYIILSNIISKRTLFVQDKNFKDVDYAPQILN